MTMAAPIPEDEDQHLSQRPSRGLNLTSGTTSYNCNLPGERHFLVEKCKSAVMREQTACSSIELLQYLR